MFNASQSSTAGSGRDWPPPYRPPSHKEQITDHKWPHKLRIGTIQNRIIEVEIEDSTKYWVRVSGKPPHLIVGFAVVDMTGYFESAETDPTKVDLKKIDPNKIYFCRTGDGPYSVTAKKPDGTDALLSIEERDKVYVTELSGEQRWRTGQQTIGIHLKGEWSLLPKIRGDREGFDTCFKVTQE